MTDLVLVLVVIRSSQSATLFVAGCGASSASARKRSAEMGAENAIGLILAVVVLAYLVYALLAPEKLG